MWTAGLSEVCKLQFDLLLFDLFIPLYVRSLLEQDLYRIKKGISVMSLLHETT